MTENDAELVQAIYSEHLATMRTLEANVFSATLRIFMLDLLIAAGLMTNPVHLHTTGRVVASVLIVGFHFLMGGCLKEKKETYKRRKDCSRETKAVMLARDPSLTKVLNGPEDEDKGERKRRFNALGIYRWCVMWPSAGTAAVSPDVSSQTRPPRSSPRISAPVACRTMTSDREGRVA